LNEVKLRREISVPHGVLLLVGTVVGAGAFILIGPLAGQTGPGLWLVFLIAAIPAVFVAVVFAQLGTAFPLTGATYVSISRVLSPVLGITVVWCTILGIFLFTLPMMAYGFAMYLRAMIPVAVIPTAIGILIFFVILNIVGIRWMMWFQSVSTLIAIVVLLAFGVGGAFFANPAYQAPLFPLGFGAVVLAIVPAYCLYTALNAITELAGETKNPRRNIPLILFISLGLLTLIYVSISYSLTGLMSWEGLRETEGAVAVAAGKFLPSPLAAYFVGIAALMAAATTINAALTFISRDVLVLSRDLVFPAAFGRVHRRFATPVRAIVLLGGVSVAGFLLAGVSPEEFVLRCATLTSYVFMLMALLACVAMFLLPRKFPQRYGESTFRLEGRWLKFFTIGGAVMFAALIIGGCISDPLSGAYLVILILTGLVYYFGRKRQLCRRGTSIEDKLKKIEEL
jgi:APA family basic amino acid/polyamine antiporter